MSDSAESCLPVGTVYSGYIAQPATSAGVFPQREHLRRPESDYWNSLSRCSSHTALNLKSLTVALADTTRQKQSKAKLAPNRESGGSRLQGSNVRKSAVCSQVCGLLKQFTTYCTTFSFLRRASKQQNTCCYIVPEPGGVTKDLWYAKP